MSAEMSTATPLTKLFEKFLKDAGKLATVKKDTDCLVAQIVAHMFTPECEEAALTNLERIFQRSFRPELTIDVEASNETEGPRSELNSPLPVKPKKKTTKKSKTPEEGLEPPVEIKEKKKPGPKAKKVIQDETTLTESSLPVADIKEKKKPGPKSKKVIQENATVVESTSATSTVEEIKEKKQPAPKAKNTKVSTPVMSSPIAKLVIASNESGDEELTEEDLLEIISDSDSE